MSGQIYLSLLLCCSLVASSKTVATGPCNCENDQLFLQYQARANRGDDVHCTAQCAHLILIKCALACPEATAKQKEEYRKIIAVGEQNLTKLPGGCDCPSSGLGGLSFSDDSRNSGNIFSDETPTFITDDAFGKPLHEALPPSSIVDSRRQAVDSKDIQLNNFVDRYSTIDLEDIKNANTIQETAISDQEEQALANLFDRYTEEDTISLTVAELDSIKYAPCYVEDDFSIHPDLAIDVWGNPIDPQRFMQRIKGQGTLLLSENEVNFYYLIERARNPEGLSKKICNVEEGSEYPTNNHGRDLFYYHLYYLLENKNDHTIRFTGFPSIDIMMESENTLNACTDFLCERVVPHSSYFGSVATTKLFATVVEMGSNSRVYDFAGAWHFSTPVLKEWRIGQFYLKP